jgi:SynChlorMet cassette radical SAM/SPASM protein ScmE
MKIMKTPKSMDLEITNRCNLRCAYCSHFTSAGDVEGDLSTGEWLAFFEALNRAAVLEVCLSGGEVLVRQDLPELIEGIVRNRMRFSILSNGTLITDEMARFLASTRRCNSVQVSIDGSIPFTHDAFRGEGNFVKAVEGLKALMRNGVAATVRVTIHRKNVDDLAAIAAFLLDDLGLPSFSTNSASFMGLCRNNAEQLLLTPRERTKAMRTLLKLVKKYEGRIGASAGPLAEARGWMEMEQARLQGLEGMPGRGYLAGCGVGRDKLAVRADGTIVPCGQLPHLELGRIDRDDLTEIWQRHESLTGLRERHLIPLDSFAFCEGCTYINFCTGNCPAIAYTLMGEVNHPSPDACLRRFLEEGGELPKEQGL